MSKDNTEIKGTNGQFVFTVGKTQAMAFIYFYAIDINCGLQKVVAVEHDGEIKYHLDQELASALVKHVSFSRMPIGAWGLAAENWSYTDKDGNEVFHRNDEMEAMRNEAILSFLKNCKFDGNSLTIPGRKGWIYRITNTDEGSNLRTSNPHRDGWEKFFVDDTSYHPYGMPERIQESTEGIPFKEAGIDVSTGNQSKDRIVGILVFDEDGKIIERASLSNLREKGIQVYIVEREVCIGGVLKGFVNGVFEADKNRLNGHVAIVQLQKNPEVILWEMESLIQKAMKNK